MKNQEERGFALVMTMAILTGMLIIIVPLVSINNLKYSEAKVAEAEALSRYGIDSARNLTQFINQRNGGRDLSGLSKTAVLPGWRDIPLLLYGSQTNTVENFVPAFLMMATPVGQVGKNHKKNGDLDHKYNEPFEEMLPGVNFTDDDWFIAGAELLSRNNRGLMGLLTSHRKKEILFGVPNNNYNHCWVKINGEWGKVLSVKYNTDLSAELKLSDGLVIQENDTVEFYPMRIHNNQGHNVDLDLRVRVIDERSKINVCSMTEQVAGTLNLNLGLNRTLPYVSPISLRIDGVNADKVIDTMSLITSYSSPDYTIISKTENDGIYGERDAYDNIAQVDGKRIYQHPININTASLNTLGIVFQSMNINNPYKIAQEVVHYRSGGGDNFDGNENPFDGFNPRNTGNDQYLASPADEFSELITTKASEEDAYKIMQHVYAYGNLAHYKKLAEKSIPLCFQMDHVQTTNITARVTSGKRPLVENKATVVSREIYHDMENSTRGRIIFDSDNGWNMGMSTFYGIEWRQPQVKNVDLVNKKITFKFDHHNNTNTWSATPTLSQGLLGRVNIAQSTYIRYIEKYKNNEIVTRAKILPTTGVKRVDFGLRVMTRPDHITKINEVKITGDKNKFSVEPAEHFISEDVKGRYFIYIPPDGGNFEIIDYEGADNDYTSTTDFDVEPGHKAYALPKFGYNDNEMIYPNQDAQKVPYYETVILRENAKWDRIRWDTLKHGPKITKITINGQVFNSEQDYDGGGTNIWTYQVNNLDSKFPNSPILRLRFEFTDDTNRTGDYIAGCPQLFRIMTYYTLPDDKPRRIVLDQR